MRKFALFVLALTAGCQPPAATDTGIEPDKAVPDKAAPSTEPPTAPSNAPSTATPAPPPVATSTPSSRFDPPVLTPEAEKGEKGARNVLLSWAAAMENRDFAAARRLFGDDGARSGMDQRTWAATYAGYRDIAIAFGDGDVEGGAGSLYYQVPVRLTAPGTAGPERRAGTITLRRVNDVDGATPAQLRWHIDTLDW